jgi:DNA primase
MKLDQIDFREAHHRLGGNGIIHSEKNGNNGNGNGNNEAEDLLWLAHTAEHYHRRLLETPVAQEYLRRRGITAVEIISAFKLGYADGTLLEKLPVKGRAALKSIGVITESGRELMKGCIIFPLVQANSEQIVSLYGRHTERQQHLYLPGERRGLFNPQAAHSTDEVIITESIIDAGSLWSVGLRNVMPIYGTTGLTDEITK